MTDQWWYISSEDMETIRAYLLVRVESGDDDAKEALHTLESGLHTTDVVPDDFSEDEDAR